MKTNTLQKGTDHENILPAKGRERRVSEVPVVVDRELARKPNTRGKLAKKHTPKRGRNRGARIKKKPTSNNVRVRASPRNDKMKNGKSKNTPKKTPSGKKKGKAKNNGKADTKKNENDGARVANKKNGKKEG